MAEADLEFRRHCCAQPALCALARYWSQPNMAIQSEGLLLHLEHQALVHAFRWPIDSPIET